MKLVHIAHAIPRGIEQIAVEMKKAIIKTGNSIYEKYSAMANAQPNSRKVNWDYVKELAHFFHTTLLVGEIDIFIFSHSYFVYLPR